MRIKYNITGANRKNLVNAIGEELKAPIKYLRAPSFTYEVGDYRIDKTGMLAGPDNQELIADLCGLHDLKAEKEEYDMPFPEAEPLSEYQSIPYEAALGGRVSPYRDSDEPPAYDKPDDNRMTIEFPLESFTEKGIANLEKLVASKAALIQKAVGTEALPIHLTETTIQFPWFRFGLERDVASAYVQFIASLCTAAKQQKRVTAKEKPVDNEKFAFRVFLIRLGFVGDDYKAARKILLKNLTGNSAFKNGVPSKQEAETDE
jgi:hypothetical protein